MGFPTPGCSESELCALHAFPEFTALLLILWVNKIEVKGDEEMFHCIKRCMYLNILVQHSSSQYKRAQVSSAAKHFILDVAQHTSLHHPCPLHPCVLHPCVLHPYLLHPAHHLSTELSHREPHGRSQPPRTMQVLLGLQNPVVWSHDTYWTLGE